MPSVGDIEKDLTFWSGKVVKVAGAIIGNGNDEVGYRSFEGGLAVKILDDYHLSWDAGLVDVRYSADAVYTGSLPAGFNVVYIYGPTYHDDGRVEYPEWWPKQQKTAAKGKMLRRILLNQITILNAFSYLAPGETEDAIKATREILSDCTKE